MLKLGRKAQSTLEYATLIAVVVGAIIAINLYLKRGMEGRIRSASDDIGTQYDVESGTYSYRSELVSNEEVTHSATGKTGEDIDLGLGWTSAPDTIGEGREVQWTEVAGEREVGDTTTTEE